MKSWSIVFVSAPCGGCGGSALCKMSFDSQTLITKVGESSRAADSYSVKGICSLYCSSGMRVVSYALSFSVKVSPLAF